MYKKILKPSDLLIYLKNNSLKKISKENYYNETDALVFANLSYCQLEDVEVTGKDKTLKVYMEKFKQTNQYKMKWEKSKDDIDRHKLKFIDYIMKNPRYKDLEILNPQGRVNTSKPEQFGAVTIMLPVNECVVAFRGTNGTVEGWYEDFCFASYLEGTYAQKESVRYLQNASKSAAYIHVTGHSKGGYISEWSSIFCNDYTKQKIKTIINFDGPGINPNVLDIGDNIKKYVKMQQFMGDNWKKIIPQDSVIGRLFLDFNRPEIVISDNVFIMQHDTFSWKFNKDRLDLSLERKTTKRSDFINEILDDVIRNTSQHDLTIVIDTSFESYIALKNHDIKGIINILGKINISVKSLVSAGSSIIMVISCFIFEEVCREIDDKVSVHKSWEISIIKSIYHIYEQEGCKQTKTLLFIFKKLIEMYIYSFEEGIKSLGLLNGDKISELEENINECKTAAIKRIENCC